MLACSCKVLLDKVKEKRPRAHIASPRKQHREPPPPTHTPISTVTMGLRKSRLLTVVDEFRIPPPPHQYLWAQQVKVS